MSSNDLYPLSKGAPNNFNCFLNFSGVHMKGESCHLPANFLPGEPLFFFRGGEGGNMSIHTTNESTNEATINTVDVFPARNTLFGVLH